MSVSAEEIAFARMSQMETVVQRLERERRDRELQAAMVGVIGDAHKSHPLDRPGWAPPKDTANRTGWRTAPPLEMPGGDRSQRIIEQMCDAMLGPGAPAALARGPSETQPPQAQPTAEPALVSAAPKAEAATAAPPAAAGAVTRRRLA